MGRRRGPETAETEAAMRLGDRTRIVSATLAFVLSSAAAVAVTARQSVVFCKIPAGARPA